MEKPKMLFKKSIISVLLTLCALALVGLPHLHADSTSIEYGVKAAYLYNFTRFIEWPSGTFSDSNGSFNICIIGRDPFGEAFKVFKKKPLKGKNLKIYQFDKIRGTDNCHIAFISQSEKDHLEEILAALDGSGALTVSDIENFALKGGIINFVKVEQNIRFEINLKEAERSGLGISAKLLSLAKTIYDK